MKDKIIQITDSINNEGDGQTLGLSESGKLYVLIERGHTVKQDVSGYPRNVYIIDSREWGLMLESPNLLETSSTSIVESTDKES